MIRRGYKYAVRWIAINDSPGLLGVDAIAETYWQIHRQPRSTWAHEVDLRPYKEPF